jgi:hypothetical protein
MGELVSFRDVYARWGYSEIDSPHRRADYDQLMEDAAASRARRAAGVAFDQLCDLEREELAIACQRVRQFFSPSTIGTKFFEARAIDRPACVISRTSCCLELFLVDDIRGIREDIVARSW